MFEGIFRSEPNQNWRRVHGRSVRRGGHFVVGQVWKGNVGARINVDILGGRCATRFRDGQTYIVFATGTREVVTAPYCWNLRMYTEGELGRPHRRHRNVPAPSNPYSQKMDLLKRFSVRDHAQS